MKKENKIYYLLATQHDNLGDLLINKMLIDELANYGDVYVDGEGVDPFLKYIIHDNVYSATDVFGASLKRKSFWRVLCSGKKFNFFFATAGPSGKVNDLKGFLTASYLLFLYAILRLKQVRIFQVGNDLSIQSDVEIFFAKSKSKLADLSLLRTQEDVFKARQKDLKRIDYIPDLAFLYRKSNMPVKNKVLVSFRDLNDIPYTESIIVFLRPLITYFQSQKIDICFFSQVSSDRNFNRYLFEQFESDGVCLNDNALWYDDINVYEDAKYVISNRLHVLLLGIVNQAIPLALLNDNDKTAKIRKIFTDVGLDSLLVGSLTTIQDLENQYEELRVQVKSLADKNYETCKEKINGLFF